MQVTEAAHTITSAGSNPRPILIAIEGFGGSGKSTVANKLADTLGNAFVISMDDFIVKEKLTEPSWDIGVFDWKRLEEQVLSPITKVRENAQFWELWSNNDLVYQQKYHPELVADFVIENY